MNHSVMDHHDPHGSMDHGSMDHGYMDHGSMDHDSMDHGSMDHDSMDHGSMDHGMHGAMNMDHMMKMYFHFSNEATILFSGWKTNSWQTMLGSCVAVFVMAFLYEVLKVGREHLFRMQTARLKREARAQRTPGLLEKSNNNPCPSAKRSPPTWRASMLSCGHALQTLLHMLQIVLSYFIMLIFMTYNVWLCLAVTLGAVTGYFLFSWRRVIVVDINEHCH